MPVVINIFEEIYSGEGGFSAGLLGRILRNAKPEDELEVNINSAGGSVFEGIAIYNMLKQHKGKKTVKVLGWAASMASVAAMAGDEIIMGDGTFMMIHNPWTMALGDSEQLRKDADLLDSIKEQILKAYMSKSKLTKDEISALMDKETWLVAEEAVELGFASGTFENTKAAACIKKDFLNKFSPPEQALKWIMQEKPEEEKTEGQGENKNAANEANTNEDREQGNKQSDEKVDRIGNAETLALSMEKAEDALRKIMQEKEELNSKLKNKEAECKTLSENLSKSREQERKLEESLNKKQSLNDKMANDIKELSCKLERLLSGGLNYEPELDSWQSALAKCGGDYVLARKSHPALFSKYIKAIQK